MNVSALTNRAVERESGNYLRWLAAQKRPVFQSQPAGTALAWLVRRGLVKVQPGGRVQLTVAGLAKLKTEESK